MLKQREVLVEMAMRNECEGWILGRIAAGHGVAMMPLFSTLSGQVISRKIEGLEPIRTAEFVTVADHPQPTSVTIMAEILSDQQCPTETDLQD